MPLKISFLLLVSLLGSLLVGLDLKHLHSVFHHLRPFLHVLSDCLDHLVVASSQVSSHFEVCHSLVQNVFYCLLFLTLFLV